jgi:hypothetical protein
MGFLRRILGSGGRHPTETPVDAAHAPAGSPPAAGNPDLAEIERTRELLREESRRVDTDLLQRQLRYADRAWTPPAQGGDARASLGDRPSED